jgi:copper chaperone CopZ
MKLIMKISGLHCERCCSTIETTLSKVNGINFATVNLGENEVFIDYDENMLELLDKKDNPKGRFHARS